MRARLAKLLITLSIVVAVAVSVGGGSTFVALEVTCKPEFCTTCHNMQPYYDSWKESSHNQVTCVDCHYEPGLLGTVEGKFQALSQLAKYVTSTEGSKPWAEVSDNSCMRSGCHSDRMLQGDLQFGRVRFDHRDHLIGLRRDKQLRCTSCHSQIVQGDHLTVTPTTCYLCHFKEGEGTEPIDDCSRCHGAPPESIDLHGFEFEHAQYLQRGVGCDTCHGDVTRGTGEVPPERCGSCHNQQQHLERIGEVEFIHKNHVTDHSVTCFDCHLEIQHGLPALEDHYAGNCTDCHSGSHGVTSDVYRGVAYEGVEENPSVMYLARVACTGCHRPPFPGAPEPPAGSTFAADPLACIDCHGPGFDGMTERWQAETRHGLEQLQSGLAELHELVEEPRAEGDRAAARQQYERAAALVSRVLLDRSEGAHNLLHVRGLLDGAAESLRAGMLEMDSRPPRFELGPSVPSQQGCTNMCHVGVEQRIVSEARGLPFDHARHVTRAGLDCSTCHLAEPHGTTTVQPADCRSCHHANEDPETCLGCHADVATLREDIVADAEPPMLDFDCLMCHMDIADDPSREALEAGCGFCHDDVDMEAVDFAGLVEQALSPLEALRARLDEAGDSLPPAQRAALRGELERLLRSGPFHNPARVEQRAAELAAGLDPEPEAEPTPELRPEPEPEVQPEPDSLPDPESEASVDEVSDPDDGDRDDHM